MGKVNFIIVVEESSTILILLPALWCSNAILSSILLLTSVTQIW